jgi:hypothetical protein
VARILLADVKHSVERLRRVLSPHGLHAATTVEGAQRLLRRYEIEMIVCGYHFDDCRMMDFLIQVKKDEQFNRIPFVCWQNDRSDLSDEAVHGSFEAAKVLGACLYLEFRQVKTMKDNDLRETLESCLPA